MKRSIRSARILFALLLSALALGCGDTADGTTDTGPAEDLGQADAGTPDTGVVIPDAGRRDVGTPDFGPSEYCVEQDQISVDGTNVPVTQDPSGVALSPAGPESDLECLDERPTSSLRNQIAYRGCMYFAGPVPSITELEQEVQIDVFQTPDNNGDPVDPGFDPNSGRNHYTGPAHPEPDVVFEIVPASVCPSARLMTIGRDAMGANSLRSDLEYVIRIRSSTTSAGTWATTYYQGVNKRAALLPTVDVRFFRENELRALITGAGLNIPEAGDLSDYRGPGYGIIEALDCNDAPIAKAVGGFAPAPTGRGYLAADLSFSAGATETSASAMLAGLGFANTSTTGRPVVVRGALGAILTAGACTEQYSGRGFLVYPDSLSIIRIGQENTLNAP